MKALQYDRIQNKMAKEAMDPKDIIRKAKE